MNPKALHFVSEGNYKYQGSVFIDSWWDGWFSPEHGVIQGVPLSVSLYLLHVNKLMQIVINDSHGLMVDIKVTSTSYTDDIATGALYKAGLNSHPVHRYD